MRVRSSAIIAVLLVCEILLCFATRGTLSVTDSADESNSVAVVEEEGIINATSTAESNASRRSDDDSFAGMIDRALEREFPENEQNEGFYVLRSKMHFLFSSF
jgi:hypothetical protein